MDNLKIGNKIRTFRKIRGESIKTLAESAGITSSMLSQIEREIVNPSINTLRDIAKSLDVPMFRFFKDDTENRELVVRRESRKRIGLPHSQDVSYELLTPNIKGSIEFCLMTIPPHRSSVEKPKNHPGEEAAFVMEGAVDIIISEQRWSLQQGDSISIPSQSYHKWDNTTDFPVQVIFAVTPPGF